MGMPTDVPVIDTMIGFPAKDMKAQYAFITQQTKDTESKDDFEFPVEYMFKAPPDKDKALRETDDPVGYTLSEMDKWGVQIGMVGVSVRGADGVSEGEATGVEALDALPRPLHRLGQRRPQRGHGGHREDREGLRDLRGPGRHHVPGRVLPAGRDQRQEDVPDLRQVL